MKNKNKREALFLFVILLWAGFFGFTVTSAAKDTSVVINEIQIAGESPDDDFIELYNPGCKDLNISGWKLRKRTKSGTESSIKVTSKGKIIKAKGYFLWINSKGTLSEKVEPDETSQVILSENYSIALLDASGEIIDSLTWGASDKPFDNSFLFPANPEKNQSLKRKNDDFEISNSPSPQNSDEIIEEELKKCITEPPLSVVYSDKIIINELLPKPDSENNLYKEEFVELFNGGDNDENLTGWFLKDRAGKLCDLSGETMGAGSFLVVKNNPDKKCTLALNDTQGEFLGLYSPADKDRPVSSVSYEGSAKKGKSYSFDGEQWRWSQYLTLREDNLFNNLPIVSSKKENEIYVGVYAQFSAKGSDGDGEKLKFTWDFGDGHKSYLQNTQHKYAKTGNYTAILKVTDGNEDVLETFKIKVIKFPKIKFSIKELSANPAGLDTKEDGEYIVIKNESGKKINLKGWSIATGSKNLYNHPIIEDFVLKPGQSKKITRKYSKFALANQKCKIEIRYPNGKVAYKLKYDKDRIAENEIYKKVDGKWAWIRPQIDATLVLTATEIAQANPEEAIVQQDIEVSPEDLGKQTLDENKIKNRIVLASYGTHLSLPDDLGSQPRVLGASTVRNDSQYFSFGRPYVPEPHWAVTFVNYLAETLNSTLNNALNFFS